MLPEAHDNDALSQAMTCKWFRQFKNGNTVVDDDEQTHRSLTPESRPLIAQFKKLFKEIVDWVVPEEVGISIVLCHPVLTEDLGMHQVSAKLEPVFLTEDQKLQQFSIFESLLQITDNDESLWKMSYWWWDMGLQLWQWNQTTTLMLEEAFFTSLQKKAQKLCS